MYVHIMSYCGEMTDLELCHKVGKKAANMHIPQDSGKYW